MLFRASVPRLGVVMGVSLELQVAFVDGWEHFILGIAAPVLALFDVLDLSHAGGRLHLLPSVQSFEIRESGGQLG